MTQSQVISDVGEGPQLDERWLREKKKSDRQRETYTVQSLKVPVPK